MPWRIGEADAATLDWTAEELQGRSKDILPECVAHPIPIDLEPEACEFTDGRLACAGCSSRSIPTAPSDERSAMRAQVLISAAVWLWPSFPLVPITKECRAHWLREPGLRGETRGASDLVAHVPGRRLPVDRGLRGLRTAARRGPDQRGEAAGLPAPPRVTRPSWSTASIKLISCRTFRSASAARKRSSARN